MESKIFYKKIDITYLDRVKLKDLVKIMEELGLYFKGVGNGKVKIQG